MNRQYVSIAMAYVGVLVGAGLSSGQDILQYFLSFGEKGLVGILLLGILNVVFGRIIITLGCHFQSSRSGPLPRKWRKTMMNCCPWRKSICRWTMKNCGGW